MRKLTLKDSLEKLERFITTYSDIYSIPSKESHLELIRYLKFTLDETEEERRVVLIFSDWHENGNPMLNKERHLDLSMHDFHEGSTFPGTIKLSDGNWEELMEAIKGGAQPIFQLDEA